MATAYIYPSYVLDNPRDLINQKGRYSQITLTPNFECRNQNSTMCSGKCVFTSACYLKTEMIRPKSDLQTLKYFS